MAQTDDRVIDWSALDLGAHWMPFTGNRQFKRDPRLIVAASGAYLRSSDGREIFDGLSGLWCTGLGHCRPEIARAVTEQLATLDYAPAFQFGHPGAFRLASRLAELAPADLNRVFFTSSGSEAVDTALKIARGYWRAKGEASKVKLIGREKGYHGVNFGGIGVGGIGANRKPFGPGLDADHLPHTQLAGNAFSRGVPVDGGKALADELLDLIALHDASNIGAVIVEPFSGSGGVVVPPLGYLQRLREICDQHRILLIFDEVISGFGRSGAWFGADVFGVVPDMIIFAKQVTNGAVPLGGVIARQGIYDAYTEAGGPDYMVEFPHGYTYSAHPVACAASLATLDLLVAEDVPGRAARLAPVLEDAVHGLKGARHVTDIRNFGLAAGLTFDPVPGEPARRPFEIAMRCWEQGVYVRYGGDTIQLAPPFIADAAEIERMVGVLGQAIAACD
ncbi:MAG TPA: aspartate aminotransferase family protein [Novosphingobium sp.]|nr:aspartate aminotransferase family protein [Novosphingobium sp.]